jgi:hypothetical protein
MRCVADVVPSGGGQVQLLPEEFDLLGKFETERAARQRSGDQTDGADENDPLRLRQGSLAARAGFFRLAACGMPEKPCLRGGYRKRE